MGQIIYSLGILRNNAVKRTIWCVAIIIAGICVYNYFFAWCYCVKFGDYHADKDCKYFQRQINALTDGEYFHSDIVDKSRKYEGRKKERCWYCW